MEVDERLLGELEAMGFSEDLARKAISSGNSSIEAAVNWIVDHGNDNTANETQMSQILTDINIEESNALNISEQVKLRAQGLRDQSSKKRREQEKKLEREREKERIRSGKDLLEAKRLAEESERKRFVAQRKAEKEEERRARDKVRQKLQQDKLERRGILGLPRVDPLSTKSDSASQNLTEPANSVKPFDAREHMNDCLRSIKRQNKEDNANARQVFQTLLIYVKNIINNPNEGKFRRIRISNPVFQDRIGRYEEGLKFLELCGFERVEGDNFLLLPKEKVDIGILKMAWAELQNALTNPFFGLFSA